MEELLKEYESWNAKYVSAHDAIKELMQIDTKTGKHQLILAKIDHLRAEEQKAYNKRRALFERILKLK